MFSNDKNGDAAQIAASQSWFTKAVGALAFAASVVSAGLVIATLAMTGFSVFRRYVLGRPVTWSDELSGFLVVAIVMLGAAEVLRRGEHVSVDILTENATGRKRWWFDLWSNLSVATVSAVLFASALNAVQFSRMIGVYSDGYLEAPLWIPQSFLLAGAGLLFLMALARCFDLVLKGLRKQ
ncbi:MAG: TRAP transporter permease DctQ [Rhodobacteraceae bacterium]|nr:MAG: TRAP transporter permease DctQ [Paracoccaceae bacterium]